MLDRFRRAQSFVGIILCLILVFVMHDLWKICDCFPNSIPNQITVNAAPDRFEGDVRSPQLMIPGQIGSRISFREKEDDPTPDHSVSAMDSVRGLVANKPTSGILMTCYNSSGVATRRISLSELIRNRNPAQVVHRKAQRQREDHGWDPEQKLVVIAGACCMFWVIVIIILHVFWF